jgi:hypothetical protein
MVLRFKKQQRLIIVVSLDKMKTVTITEPIRKISTAIDPDYKREEQEDSTLTTRAIETHGKPVSKN